MANKNPKRENLKPWPKGVSGNPAGAQKKIPELDKLLSDIPESDYEAIIQKLIDKAKKGDIRASEVVLDRAYGKPKEKIEVVGSIKSYTIRGAGKRTGDSSQ